MLLFPSCIIPYGRNILKRIEYDVKLDTQNIHSELLSEIEKVAKLLLPINSSATSLARILSPSINGTKPSFTNIETKVSNFPICICNCSFNRMTFHYCFSLTVYYKKESI